MGIGGRLLRLARANLSALLDAVDDDRPPAGGFEGLSDEDLRAELDRRRRQREREAAERRVRERAERAARERLQREGAGRTSTPRPPGAVDPRLARYYAQLEVPFGADLETVKRGYRRLMRKYHPDRHTKDPEKQRIATQLSQALGEAYRELERALTAHP